MLNIEVDTACNVVLARPEGSLSAADFEKLGQEIEAYVRERGRLPGLVVFLKGLPHWEGLAALRAHFDLVRKQSAVLPRVAVVTDVMGLSHVPGIANVFVRARLRQFDLREQDQAIAWAGSPETSPEGYQLLDGYPDNVIAIRASGEVTSGDYEDKLIPLVQEKSKLGKLRLLMVIGPDFEGYSAGALWDDARLGVTHWRSFERVAVVTDIGWITRSLKLFAPLMPGEVAVFPLAAQDAAKAWISGDGAPAAGKPGTDA
ncbi:STAS/SEC14 domain-containing protein [Paracoccus sp. NGMCC 1.201697]|uniref:STAS/SEC14 domain-containing protein n=1 Tax=Paracoccus broussonetiae subsp. drimophilus TaxID=3373869 RepID=A0ABW7LKT6_9RHOB